MIDKILIERSMVEQALEALKYEKGANNPLDWHHDKTMNALRAALEQPPVVEQSDGDTVPVPRSLLGAACAAISSKRDAPKVLEQLRRYTTGDLSTPAAAPQQVEQEPAWYHKQWSEDDNIFYRPTEAVPEGATPLYTHPQPKREPLTDEKINAIWKSCSPLEDKGKRVEFARRLLEARDTKEQK